jgi:hypothetical protein
MGWPRSCGIPPGVRLIVWLKEYFGPIVNTSGKAFEELPAYMAPPENTHILCVQKSDGSPQAAEGIAKARYLSPRGARSHGYAAN